MTRSSYWLRCTAVAAAAVCACSSGTPQPAPSDGGWPTPQRPRSAQPEGFYTDLLSAPVGAFVTVHGRGFGENGAVTLGGVAQAVVGHADDRIVFRVSGAGGNLVVNGGTLGSLPVHQGRVLQATPTTLRSVWAGVRPGDVVYLRAGTYTEPSAEGDWNMLSVFETWKKGTAERPIAVVAWPGEAVTLRPEVRPAISLGDGGRNTQHAEYLTFAGLHLLVESMCINGGGDVTADSSASETGGRNIRIVDIGCEITDAVSNTMGSAIAIQSDGWQVLGVRFYEPPRRAIFNNNHAIYVANGADDVEIAYNRLVNLRMGHVIQIHQDGEPRLFERVWIHDNLLEGAAGMDMRGITVSNVAAGSSVVIERNTLRNLGQEFSGIAVYSGSVSILNNQFQAVRAPNILLNGMPLGPGGSQWRRVVAEGNRFEVAGDFPVVAAAGGSASLAEIRLRGNTYCGVDAPRGEQNPRPCTGVR
jgi:Right handed beta helix region